MTLLLTSTQSIAQPSAEEHSTCLSVHRARFESHRRSLGDKSMCFSSIDACPDSTVTCHKDKLLNGNQSNGLTQGHQCEMTVWPNKQSVLTHMWPQHRCTPGTTSLGNKKGHQSLLCNKIKNCCCHCRCQNVQIYPYSNQYFTGFCSTPIKDYILSNKNNYSTNGELAFDMKVQMINSNFKQ